jgi:hypothetical protein
MLEEKENVLLKKRMTLSRRVKRSTIKMKEYEESKVHLEK